MKISTLIALFFFSSVLANAEEFELQKSETRDTYKFIEMQYGAFEGESFSTIFNKIKIKEKQIYLRILGTFSLETSNELITYYTNTIPSELEKALATSGNLHNPTLDPLWEIFSQAFRTTNLFAEIENEFKKQGFSVTEIEFEKFTINTKEKAKIHVADIWLKAQKDV